jgi:hypothetical protein
MKIIQILILTAAIGLSFSAQAKPYELNCGTSIDDGGPSQDIIIRHDPVTKKVHLSYSTPDFHADKWHGPIKGSVISREYETIYSFQDGSIVVIDEQQEQIPSPTGRVSFAGAEAREIVCGSPQLVH